MSFAAGGKGPRSDINVTQLIDVVLVLLIVFMVTAPLLTVGVPVELPRTDAKQLESETDPLSITIREDETLRTAVTMMDTNRIKRLIVTDAERKVRGVVSRGDLIRLYAMK